MCACMCVDGGMYWLYWLYFWKYVTGQRSLFSKALNDIFLYFETLRCPYIVHLMKKTEHHC